jgi:hypothetical protein
MVDANSPNQANGPLPKCGIQHGEISRAIGKVDLILTLFVAAASTAGLGEWDSAKDRITASFMTSGV